MTDREVWRRRVPSQSGVGRKSRDPIASFRISHALRSLTTHESLLVAQSNGRNVLEPRLTRPSCTQTLGSLDQSRLSLTSAPDSWLGPGLHTMARAVSICQQSPGACRSLTASLPVSCGPPCDTVCLWPSKERGLPLSSIARDPRG